MLPRIIRLFRQVLLALLLGIGLYFLVAAICLFIPVNSSWKPASQGTEIYVLSNGVHTDLVFPVRYGSTDWSDFVSAADTRSGNADYAYVAFGWGDRGIYLETPSWSDLKFSTAFKALFWLDDAAMHVSWKRSAPKESSRCVKLRVSDGEYARLVNQVRESFGKNGASCIRGKSYGFTDAFYAANDCYSLFNTCNTWTGRVLRGAGIRAAAWTPFDKSVFYQLKNLSA